MTAPKSPPPSTALAAQEPRYPMPWPPITYVVITLNENAPLGRRMHIVKMGGR